MSESLSVLRWGYRRGRDPRITTHLGLVARALGADSFLLSGEEDQDLFDSISSVCERFGGDLEMSHVSGLSFLKNHVKSGGIAVHLTMYGEPYREALQKIPRGLPTVAVVGGAKVPGDVFKVCQYNVAVGNQPHSEIAALALFMDAWFDNKSTERSFEDAQLIIEGTNNGKIVIENVSLDDN